LRSKRFHKWLAAIVFLVACVLWVSSWVIRGSAASALPQAEAGPSNLYLPLIMRLIPPTPTLPPAPTPTVPGCPAHNYAFELRVYELINEIRQDNGLATLSVNYPLEISSGLHSDDMAVNNFINHTGSDGSTFWQRAQDAGYTGHWGAEIIVTASTPEQAVDWWMNEPLHHDMIVGDFQDFGSGYSYCNRGYFTVDFGHR
jgi:uncharacterized protein YkwD